MKVKVSKKELYECVERAVIRAINESKKASLKEGWDDDDDGYDPTEKWDRQLSAMLKADKKRGKAKAAFTQERKKEMDAERADDDSLERAEKADMAQKD